MRFRLGHVLLSAGILVLVYVAVFQNQVIRGWFIDTSPATAAKIQPGMTLEEAEQIIGGPPGYYALSFPSITGTNNTFSKGVSVRPNLIVWEGYQGRIEVRDGDTWPRELQRLLGQEPDGVVDSVTWKPRQRRGNQDTLDVTFTGLALVFVAGFVYFGLRELIRIGRPVPP